MARKSQRLSSGPNVAAKHKRAASNSEPASADVKQSKRQKATSTKSEYFEPSGKHGKDVKDETSDEEESSPDDEDISNFGDEAESSSSSDAEDDDDDDDYESEREVDPQKRKKTTPGKGTSTATPLRTKGNDLLRPGVKTGLGPGTQVVIKKPKSRPAGKTPYRDAAIHPNTLLFLKDLKSNNERQWLKSEWWFLTLPLCNIGVEAGAASGCISLSI